MFLVLFFTLSVHALVATVYQSSAAGDRLRSYNVSFLPTPPPNVSAVNLDPSVRRQTIMGFGGAFTEASGSVLQGMSPKVQDEILSAYFGDPSSSNSYSIGRVHIGSCDFSLSSYSYCDSANDYNLTNFSIAHDHLYLLPFVQKAQQLTAAANLSSIKIFGSPWSPPAWMKNNNEMNGSDVECLKPDTRVHQSWATYLSRFVTAWQQEGVPIWGLSLQNEPTANGHRCGPAGGVCEACFYIPEAYRNFLRDYLGPVLRKDHPSLKILFYDDDKEALGIYAAFVLDKDTAQFVDGIAVHWYWVYEDFGVLDKMHAKFPDKFLFGSEACNCDGVQIGNWSRGEHYGRDIIGDLSHWATGWVDWNLLLNPQGGPNHGQNYCDAGIIADAASDSFALQPSYFFMAHFSRFVRPGAINVPATASADVDADNIRFAAFLNPLTSSITLVIMNQGDTDQNLALSLCNFSAAVGVPQHSIQTYNLPNPCAL